MFLNVFNDNVHRENDGNIIITHSGDNKTRIALYHLDLGVMML